VQRQGREIRAAAERFRTCLDGPGGYDHVEDLLAVLTASFGSLLLMTTIASAAAGNDLLPSPFHGDLQEGDTMSDYDPKTNIHVTPGPPSSSGGLYFIVGALVVAVLVGAYFMFGAPGLHSNVARAPDRNVNVTVEQPAQPAPANPAPAPQRQQ
jgi:hypothetical protein